jgi:hypothetical protein
MPLQPELIALWLAEQRQIDEIGKTSPAGTSRASTSTVLRESQWRVSHSSRSGSLNHGRTHLDALCFSPPDFLRFAARAIIAAEPI